MAESSDWRKQGIARMMVLEAVEKGHHDYPSSGIFLDAQTCLRAFYPSPGFRVCGEECLEDGIPHVLTQM